MTRRATSGDVSKVSSITLKAARIEATDANTEDISFISGATISVNASGLSSATIANLPSPPAAGQHAVDLQVTGTELKPYIQANGTMDATIHYSPTPVNARDLKLTLTIHGSLL